MLRAPKLSIMAVAAVTAACGTDAPEPPVVAVRDSAGIRIVESRAPGGVAPVYAELGDVELEIGVVEGEAAYTFENVLDVASLPGGQLVVAERGRARELRIYDESGTHLRTLGGPGEGPGEFGDLTALAGVTADTIRAWDFMNGRLSEFVAGGQLLGDVRLELDASRFIQEVSYLTDGTYVLRWRANTDLGGGRRSATEVFGRVDSRSRFLDTVAVLRGSESISSEPTRRQDSNGGYVFVIRLFNPPVPNAAFAAVGADRVFTGRNERYRLERRTPSGEIDLIILAPDLERSLDVAEVDAIRSSMIDRCDATDDCIANVDRQFEEFELPELRPAFSALMVDAVGNLWVAEWEPDPAAVSGWHASSPDGELLGRVATPPGLTVHEIGEDYLLGVVTNELDVPYVRRYGLTRLR